MVRPLFVPERDAQTVEIAQELRNLAVTREHIDWIGDLLGKRYPSAVGPALAHHLEEEEVRHHVELERLRSAFPPGSGPLGDALEAESFYLHLFVEHLGVAAKIAGSEIPPDLEAKLIPHILEEEARHLEALARAEKALKDASPRRARPSSGEVSGHPKGRGRPLPKGIPGSGSLTVGSLIARGQRGP